MIHSKTRILYILAYNPCNARDSLILIHGRICKTNNNKIFKFYCKEIAIFTKCFILPILFSNNVNMIS